MAPIRTWCRLHTISGVILGSCWASCVEAAVSFVPVAGPDRPALVVAVERGQQAVVEELLKEGAELDVRTPDGVTPLYAAAFHGRREILRLLLEAGAEVDGRAACGRTPLFTAAAEGRVSAIELLLASGADPNARSGPGELAQTPLHMAAVEGQADTARRLIAAGADVNARSDRYEITPLYLAWIAGHLTVAQLLREHGADPAITDLFGQTPSRAAAVMAQRADRKLLRVDDESLGFDARAVVLMAYVGVATDRQSYRGNRVAVVVGDGPWLATAAHCVEDFVEARRRSVLAVPLVLSPYHGDVFEAEIIGVDQAMDLGILKVRWERHPALRLAEEDELQTVDELFVASYARTNEAQAVARAAGQLSAERLPVVRAHDPDGRRRVVLTGARYVGPGWSGSPMIVPDNGRLAGVFASRNDMAIDGRPVWQIRVGPSANTIREFMEAHGVEPGCPPQTWQTVECAPEAFADALGWLDAQAGRPAEEGVAAGEAFVRRRPRSGLAHLFLAMSLADVARTRSGPVAVGEPGSAETHYREAVRLAPDSLMVRAVYGLYLARQNRGEEALAELVEAERIEPDNSFVLALRLRTLAELRPGEAVELGERLTHDGPEHADYWFHYAGALRSVGRLEDAVRAAEAAVRHATEEQYWYRGRLADLLACSGRLSEAEACYRELVEQPPGSAVFWLWYAQFLVERMPDRSEEARRAIDQCERLNRPGVVPQKVLNDLRGRIPP